MSSRRSRRGGVTIGTTLRRKYRSSRNLPFSTSLRRSLRVAARMRRSTLRVSGAADPAELALLEDPQELGLEIERQLAQLVEEHGAAVGQLEGALSG